MNKKAIVTGGSRGIGAAIVETLAENGFDVLFNYKSNATAAEVIEKKYQDSPTLVKARRADISDYTEATTFVTQSREILGDVDLLVNNAGITRDRPLFFMSEKDWNSVIDTNVNGLFNVTRNLMAYFMKNKRGAVISIASIAGLKGVAGQTGYCASKSAVIGFTRALAKEAAKVGIPVNCIAPGYIDTDMTRTIPEKHIEELKEMIPMKRLGNARDVADLVLFLASDKARYITGQVISVDGGLSA
jgi:3-oxoacyl-[acyl-carrier protein] reductase